MWVFHAHENYLRLEAKNGNSPQPPSHLNALQIDSWLKNKEKQDALQSSCIPVGCGNEDISWTHSGLNTCCHLHEHIKAAERVNASLPGQQSAPPQATFSSSISSLSNETGSSCEWPLVGGRPAVHHTFFCRYSSFFSLKLLSGQDRSLDDCHVHRERLCAYKFHNVVHCVCIAQLPRLPVCDLLLLKPPASNSTLLICSPPLHFSAVFFPFPPLVITLVCFISSRRWAGLPAAGLFWPPHLWWHPLKPPHAGRC